MKETKSDFVRGFVGYFIIVVFFFAFVESISQWHINTLNNVGGWIYFIYLILALALRVSVRFISNLKE